MVKIRLRKPGKPVKGRYHFKIVVTDLRSARDSKFIEEIGYYDPSRKLLKCDLDRYESWIKKGAKPTETVASLVERCRRYPQAPLEDIKAKKKSDQERS